MNGAGETRRRGRVLVVDDQPVNLQLMAEVLRESYDVLVATSGARALEIASSGNADLILLDVEMPEMDGIEVCSRLKADPRTRSLPVLFVTARGDAQDEARGFDAGGVDYIIKPVSGPLVCARVKTHLELKIARDALEKMALVDGLTGIANRRRFDEALRSEWRRSARGGRPLSLILFDVDHFKRFNDTWGHIRGDECLRAVATVLSEECARAADVVARYGGEEFALILPDTKATGVTDVLRRLLRRFKELRVPGGNSEEPAEVSLSGGGVSVIPAIDGAPTDALNLADDLLYQAKSAGRERVLYRDLTAESAPSEALVLQV